MEQTYSTDASDLQNMRKYHNQAAIEEDEDAEQDTAANVIDESYILPDVVRDFILYFNEHVVNREVGVIQNIYENSWQKLSDRFFSDCTWPPVDTISQLVNGNEVFLYLYKELYYRHIYAKLNPTLEQRFESFENYCDLFNYILNPEGPVDLEMPTPWLWDIIDEFIYQFQAYCQFKSVHKGRSMQDVEHINNNPHIWDVQSVLKILYSVVEQSKINDQLIAFKNGSDPALVSGIYGGHQLYRQLGYFSLIGLCRVHCILGDYYTSLKVLEHVELNKKGIMGVPACQTTTYYYVAFAYMMMRRNKDTIRVLSSILTYIHRTKQFNAHSYQYEDIQKKNEQMYAMLAIAVSLSPTRLDDNLDQQLREKFGDKMQRIQRGEDALEGFKELFMFCSPKFVTPVGPPADGTVQDYALAAQAKQMKLFLADVGQQVDVPTIRSYLKLYTTMPISKLATFIQTDEETFRTYLFLYKHKLSSVSWSEGSPLTGERTSGSDVDFYLDADMIHIADTKIERRFGQYYLRQVDKLAAIQRSMQRKLWN
ncbi:hypothetical protein SARC_02567 [Sphaeroforma arctica JP610]|uniref:Eukaryotic translation initiation factor 3 subunit L n=1 Tax=Sphaeroforma arctica JP610 TaxID=667725 RepID=A0A0L0G866_9EUKA|nr:hypothetical protein SARC_02567 [Sphaeroforma arctica JP610]KNC85232.1 hypothetical protein SARC_02567 [Sphaeroforma arctica JP610]|eukprot:XP_014159134.1 hypothetical protein SARC_02567 [Sphaeroforma arctica JP610]